jgi:tRNA A-37 threonylcarbamoyl transferase component Bud32
LINTKGNMSSFDDLKNLKIIREIPNKRAVFSGIYKNHRVIVKKYFNKNDYKKELTGSFMIAQSEVLTPKIYAFGKSENFYFIFFEKINNAINLSSVLNDKKNIRSIQFIVKKLLELNKEMYANNIIQKDNHLDNYILSDDKIYAIDGGLVKRLSFFKTIRKVINFSLILSKILPKYLNGDEYYSDKFVFKKMQNYFKTFYTYKAIKNYQKKTLRSSTEFLKISSFTKLILKKRNFNFDYSSIENYLDDAVILKNGNTCTVFKKNGMVIKRYNTKNFWHFVKKQFSKSRGLRSWQIANSLKLLHLPTPEPYFFLEKKFLFLKFNSFFVSEYISGQDIKLYESKITSHTRRKELITILTKVFKKFSYFKFIHGDLKASNIIMNHTKSEIFFIDFDKSFFCRYQSVYNHKILKQLNRFYENWSNNSKFFKLLKNNKKEFL